ncbi:biotin--[acetyl-CoA-carboxylase] ligase [Microbacterium sp. NPDC087665]|uniref:biotin--[acetyl-CoA-carboxylase] ligase n=1 Tax=Microbacterium sp. NPDC087665 TaxID=3364194 RepID=UPI003801A70C
MDFPLARRAAARFDVVDETGSTNADLRAHAADADAWPHLSVLVTRNQTAGRGRLDRTWVAPAGSALAVSILIRRALDPSMRGWIPLIAGVAMADSVAAQLPDRVVAVKWPNDVLVDERKISGILAEVAGDAIIVGAGVNTAMTEQQLPVPTATSFAVSGGVVDEDRLLADYLRTLDRHLESLVATGDAIVSGLHARATARSATLGRAVRVWLPGDRMLDGTAAALDGEGRLVVDADGESHVVSAGDVVHVRAN